MPPGKKLTLAGFHYNARAFVENSIRNSKTHQNTKRNWHGISIFNFSHFMLTNNERAAIPLSNKHIYPKFLASLPTKVRGGGCMCQHVISMVISDVCESGANYKLWTHPAFQFISSDRGNCATCLIYSINPHGLCFKRIMTIQFSTIELWLIKDFCVL